MEPGIAKLVERLHSSPVRCSIITTGAGGLAVSALLGVPGCSRTLIDAHIPYHLTVSRGILDHYPRSLVSEKVGVELAQAAFHKGVKTIEGDGADASTVIGVGATAAIATDRARKGADVAYIACWARGEVTKYRVLLDKNDARSDQEAIVSRVLLAALADGARVPHDDCLELPAPTDDIPGTAADAANLSRNGSWFSRSVTPVAKDPFQSLLDGDVPTVVVNRNGCPRLRVPPFCEDDVAPSEAHYLLYPGSFNPLHWGHTELARVASQVVKDKHGPKPVIITYEVAVSRVGKADLGSAADLHAHARQFSDAGHRVAFTTAKLFVDKAKAFPHHGLVVGIDTVVRVLDPKYYNDDRDQMLNALRQIRSCNCYFVVGGRIKDGKWIDLSGVDVPAEVADMFVPIPQRLFRVDISSTEIRRRRNSTPPAA